MEDKMIKLGSEVEYRRAWGRGGYAVARVISIEIVPERTEITEISWLGRDDAIFVLTDGHWCEGRQIECLMGLECSYCSQEFEDEEQVDRCDCEASQKARDLDRELDRWDSIRKGE